jgi:hypothetical protein
VALPAGWVEYSWVFLRILNRRFLSQLSPCNASFDLCFVAQISLQVQEQIISFVTCTCHLFSLAGLLEVPDLLILLDYADLPKDRVRMGGEPIHVLSAEAFLHLLY